MAPQAGHRPSEGRASGFVRTEVGGLGGHPCRQGRLCSTLARSLSTHTQKQETRIKPIINILPGKKIQKAFSSLKN